MKMFNGLLSPKVGLYLSWAQLGIGIIGWPLSAFTLARDEPQFILGLSWWAIIITAHGNLIAAKVQGKR